METAHSAHLLKRVPEAELWFYEARVTWVIRAILGLRHRPRAAIGLRKCWLLGPEIARGSWKSAG